MIQIEYLPIVLTGIGIIVSILYYASVLRNANKTQQLQLETRQTQLFMQVYNEFCRIEIQEAWNDIFEYWNWIDYDDFIKKYGGEENNTQYSRLSALGTYFEGIGVLVKRGLIDPALVDDMMSGHIIMLWEKLAPLYVEIRIRYNWPQCAEYWEYLYNQIKPIRDKQHPELKT